MIGVECELWIPAARSDAIRAENAEQLRAKLVVPGANIAVTEAAEALLHERGVVVVPDFIANAGGVICAALEYRCATQETALRAIEEKISANTAAVLALALRDGVTPQRAAVDLATQRVRRAMGLRRWSVS